MIRKPAKPIPRSQSARRKTAPKSGEQITEWRAEFFIPFELLIPIKNRKPTSGTTWRANIYRVDYDHGSTNWTWQPVTTDFHDIYSYGILLFE